MTKKEILELANRGEGPLGRCADDEPVFILRAQDQHAPSVVADWARRAAADGSPPHKVKGAQDDAQKIALWQQKNGCKLPD